MLLHTGRDRSDKLDLAFACLLSAVAGGLNAAAFLAVGFFSANMTGNASLLADHLAFLDWRAGGFCALLIVTFISGAMFASLIVNAGLRGGERRIFAMAVLVEGFLLLALLLAVAMSAEPASRLILVTGLAFVLGYQNAFSTKISDGRTRTTHISGIATDIGIELGELADRLRGKPVAEQRQVTQRKIRLHLLTILAFVFGGIGGIFLYRSIGDATLSVAALALFAICLPALRRVRAAR